MYMYHFNFFCVFALFSPLGHCFCSIVLLEHLNSTRRYITRRAIGSSDNRGASYRHEKPPKLALFSGVRFPHNKSLRICKQTRCMQLFSFELAGYFSI